MMKKIIEITIETSEGDDGRIIFVSIDGAIVSSGWNRKNESLLEQVIRLTKQAIEVS